MEKAEDCQNIEEIRNCIDSIDKSIISQLFLRSSYVKCASKYKNIMQEVKAEDRIKSMIMQRRKWAEENELNPDFIQFLFENIVEYFISKESIEWQKKNQ